MAHDANSADCLHAGSASEEANASLSLGHDVRTGIHKQATRAVPWTVLLHVLEQACVAMPAEGE